MDPSKNSYVMNLSSCPRLSPVGQSILTTFAETKILAEVAMLNHLLSGMTTRAD
jgi:hypothetical protein